MFLCVLILKKYDVFYGADDDAESTLEMASNAGVDIFVKDSLLCSFPTCENVRMVKHDKCKDHRKLFENALSDATPEEATVLKNMSYDELEDIFQKRARAGAGPPGRGSKKRSYVYAIFFQEKKTSSFNQGHVVCEPVTHFRFMKRMAEEKNWLAEKADKNFWERAAGKVQYPERDFLGDDDCSCGKPACCEGRLRIKMSVQEQNIIGHRAESSSTLQSGMKDKRSASHEYVEGLSRNLMSGHASWNDTSVFGKSGAALAKTAGLGISSYHQEDFEIEDPVLRNRQIKKTKKENRDGDSATTTASSAATTNLNKRKAPPSVTSTVSSTPFQALGASATDGDETAGPPSGRKGGQASFV